MQAPSSLHDFPHAPPSASKRRIQTELLAEATHLQQQQLDDQRMFPEEQPPNKRQRPGVGTNFLYKLTEFAAYTVAAAAEAYQTMAGDQTKEYHPNIHRRQQQQQQTNFNNRYSTAFDGYGDDIMQIKAGVDEDTEMNEEDNITESPEIESSQKTHVDWSNVNADEEEPPPPYDSSWSMPPTQRMPMTNAVDPFSELPRINTTEPQLIEQKTQNESQQTQPISSSPTFGASRRRQIRVRRGNRPIRRKSSSASLNAATYHSEDGEEDIFLKFNGKLSDMIAEGRAALTSTVDVTEVEIMLAEEREREERILREYGLPTQTTRRHRRMTSSSSTSGEYDYFNHSSRDSNSYLNTNIVDHSCGGNLSGTESPTGYSSTPGYSTTPTRYGSPNTYGTSLFGGSALGSALTAMNGSTLGSAFASNITKNLGSTSGSLYGTSSSPYRSSSILGATYGSTSPIIGGSGLGYGSNSATSSGTLGREPSINGSGSVMFGTRKYY